MVFNSDFLKYTTTVKFSTEAQRYGRFPTACMAQLDLLFFAVPLWRVPARGCIKPLRLRCLLNFHLMMLQEEMSCIKSP